MRPRPLLWALVVVLASSACTSGGNSFAIPTTPTVVNESFTGTVTVGGNDSHPFTVTADGYTLAVTLTAAGPPPTIFMGLGIGTVSGSTCSLSSNASTSAQAGATAQLSGTAGAGPYCVIVFDIGNQSAPVTYAVTVSHY